MPRQTQTHVVLERYLFVFRNFSKEGPKCTQTNIIVQRIKKMNQELKTILLSIAWHQIALDKAEFFLQMDRVQRSYLIT